MKMRSLNFAAVAVALIASTPALAQNSTGMMSDHMASGSMSSSSNMHMSSKDKKMMARCQGMSHDAMMANSGCMKMMKMHPDMMQGH